MVLNCNLTFQCMQTFLQINAFAVKRHETSRLICKSYKTSFRSPCTERRGTGKDGNMGRAKSSSNAI